MKVLVLNCGSSSLKYQFIDMENEDVLAKGLVERIGLDGSMITHTANENKTKISSNIQDHTDAVKLVIDSLLSNEYGVIKNLSEITAVGHRIVHGGEFFAESVVITKEVKEAIEKCNELAPLHNPPNLIGIDACEKLMKDIPQVAVFDTAFHQTMTEKSFLYALPYEFYEKYKVYKLR